MTRCHFLVHGDVQGVGYRWFVRQSAARLGLGGWVQNNPDGTVEGEAEGEGPALERFAETLRTGHPYARVEKIEAQALKARGGARTFEIR